MSTTPTRPPLRPASPTNLNRREPTNAVSRKRKREDSIEAPSSRVPFKVNAVHPVATYASATFAPVATITRSHLPLVTVNPTPPKGSLPLGYLFEAPVDVLKGKDQCTLIARLCPNGGLYAIERATNTAFIACSLHSWVTEEWCHNAGQGIITLPNDGQLAGLQSSHSRSASLSSAITVRQTTPSSPQRAKNRKGALARKSILIPRDDAGLRLDATDPLVSEQSPAYPQEASTPAIAHSITPGASEAPNPLDGLRSEKSASKARETEAAVALPSELAMQPSTVQNPTLGSTHTKPCLEQLHSQYLDTLYVSRTSLAFYAKGPLSRARAHAREGENAYDIAGLKAFYEDHVLATKKMDGKYKSALPDAIKASMNVVQDGKGRRNKTKSANAMKLGKGGLYPDEKDLVLKHWNESEVQSSATFAPADRLIADIDYVVTRLRTRETEMQILLLLEIMLLQRFVDNLAKGVPEPGRDAVKLEEQDDELTAILAKTPERKQKRRDFEAELESLIDRLCIWHTISLDNWLDSPEKSRGSSDETATKSKDKLREFCAEVIVPFYSTRLPMQAKSICRKLGGPDISPQRPRSQFKSAKPTAGSGTTGQRPKPKTKRSLERVLSEDKTMRQPSPPVLSRSSTTSIIPNLKKEPSEVNIRPMSRSAMHKSVSFTNREIDLVSDAKVQDVKKRKLDKLAKQKEELKAAIDALKKPNRTSAAQAFMDEVEQRQSDSRTHLSIPGHPIQITATPKRPRSYEATTQPQSESYQGLTALSVDDVATFIPASTIKPRLFPGTIQPPGSSKKRAVLSAIHDTPSRNQERHSIPLALPRSTLIESTPAVKRHRTDLSIETPLKAATKSGKAVFFTPVKRKEVDITDAFRDAPEIPEQAGKAMDRVMGGRGIEVHVGEDNSRELSIYQALGWDDEDD